MKVRHRGHCNEAMWECLEESPHYYVCRDRGGFSHVMLPKSSYESVPSEALVTKQELIDLLAELLKKAHEVGGGPS
jgi:hypothetical protein